MKQENIDKNLNNNYNNTVLPNMKTIKENIFNKEIKDWVNALSK